jgi:hypothetical protein
MSNAAVALYLAHCNLARILLNCDKTNRVEVKQGCERPCLIYLNPTVRSHRVWGLALGPRFRPPVGGLYRFACAAAAFQDPYERSGVVTAIRSGRMSLHPVTSQSCCYFPLNRERSASKHWRRRLKRDQG